MDKKIARVMVVEDESAFQDLIVLVLSPEPHIKIEYTADSGEEALEAFDSVAPDLVLLDFLLPGINGLETAKRMRELREDVKIALVTGYSEEVMERAAREANVDEVIPKSDFSLARIQRLLGWTP